MTSLNHFEHGLAKYTIFSSIVSRLFSLQKLNTTSDDWHPAFPGKPGGALGMDFCFVVHGPRNINMKLFIKTTAVGITWMYKSQLDPVVYQNLPRFLHGNF